MTDSYGPLDYLLRQLDAEAGRRSSLDQRTVSVLSASAAITAIGFSLTGLNATSSMNIDRYQWLKGSVLIAAGAAVAIAVLASLLTFARGPRGDDLQSLLANYGENPTPEARKVINEALVSEFKSRRASNNIRAVFVALAQLAQAGSAGGFMYLAWIAVR